MNTSHYKTLDHNIKCNQLQVNQVSQKHGDSSFWESFERSVAKISIIIVNLQVEYLFLCSTRIHSNHLISNGTTHQKNYTHSEQQLRINIQKLVNDILLFSGNIKGWDFSYLFEADD